jgi:integrase/recombinase XerD
VTTTQTVHEISLSVAEQVLADYLAALGARSSAAQTMHRRTIRDFLTFCGEARQHSPDRLLLDRDLLLRWLIRAATGKVAAYARQRLEIIGRYSRALVRAGLLQSDLMADLRTTYGVSSCGQLTQALQSTDSEAALAALQAAKAVPAPGPLAAAIQFYLELQRALAKKYKGPEQTLLDLDRFLQAQGITSPEAVTPGLIEEWIRRKSCVTIVRIQKARCASRFFDHLCSLQRVAKNPVPASLLATSRQPNTCVKPFLFTKEQLATILGEARRLPDTNKFQCRAETCSTMLVLLFALGLRHGEVCRLRLRDLDLAQQALFIDQTKFHKSRYVPFGPKVGQCLQRFHEVRTTTLALAHEDDPLFVTRSRVALSSATLLGTFRDILGRLGITSPEGQRPPRLHDLRHSCAVSCLLRWYRQGVDVQSRLPVLSTFLGHVDIHSTQVYLTVTADLLREANDRFHRQFGSQFDEER